MGKLILVAGENSSGKSVFAENLLRGYDGLKYYIATMIPAAEENEARILKHRNRREGMGFTDIEKGSRLGGLRLEPGAYVLLEDVSNLLANTVFMDGGGVDEAFSDIRWLKDTSEVLVAVTISRFDWEGTDEETIRYIRQMHEINERLAEAADVYVLMENGEPKAIKGEIPDAF